MKVLVTGGCGFIGSNAAARHMELGHAVTVLDNLSRKGTPKNLKWLKENGKFKFIKKDVRNAAALQKLFKTVKFDLVYHFAGQVAVTTSVVDPRTDFEINALGTLNVLEAMRLAKSKALIIFASTNKVYGEMLEAIITEGKTSVSYRDYPGGIPETFGLDFHSPYGCSKGAADQYVRDYHRIYGLKTVVFRQSCIYGERQFGVEDQGWAAYFIIQSAFGKPLRIYGDGKQVRDVLYIHDLLDAYGAAWKNPSHSAGQIFNIGGGPDNQISLLEFVAFLENSRGTKIKLGFHPARPGDQRIFVSDNGKLKRELHWKVKTSLEVGFSNLNRWVEDHRSIF